MSTIYERIKNETELALMKDAVVEPSNLKGCSIRLLPEYIQLIDKLAENLGDSRQIFLSALIYDAVDEALNAYASVFDSPTTVYHDMRAACGFVYGTGTKTEFFDFCRLNNLDPDDSDSMDRFQMVVDHQNEVAELSKEFTK